MTTQVGPDTLIIAGPEDVDRAPTNTVSQLRVGTLILYSFNILCSVILIIRVFLNSRDDRELKLRNTLAASKDPAIELQKVGKRGLWERIQPLTDDVFPLVLAKGITVQMVIFLLIGLKSVNGRAPPEGCVRDSELIWTAMWIPVHITIVFQMECLVRTLSNPRLCPRGKYTTSICIAIVGLLLLITWLPTRILKQPKDDKCNGQLMSYVNQFSSGGTALFVLVIPAVLFSSVVIAMHLSKAISIEERERRSATKVVYLSAIGAVQWALVLPFYATSSPTKIIHSIAFLATVVLSLQGVFASAIHLYLRSRFISPKPIAPPKDFNNKLEMGQVLPDRLPVGLSPDLSNRESVHSTRTNDLSDITNEIMSILSPYHQNSGRESPQYDPSERGMAGSRISRISNGPLTGSTIMGNEPYTPFSTRTFSKPAVYNPANVPQPLPLQPLFHNQRSPGSRGLSLSTNAPARPTSSRASRYSLSNKPPAPRPASSSYYNAYNNNQHSRSSSSSSTSALLPGPALSVLYEGDSPASSNDERLQEARRWTGLSPNNDSPPLGYNRF